MDIQDVESVCQDGDFPEGMLEEWELFTSQDRDLLEIFQFGRIFPLQRQAEMLKMLEIEKSIQPTTFMEIGSDKGGSVWAHCKALPSLKRVIACEIRGVPYLSFLQKSFPYIEFLGLNESSLTRQCVNKVREWLGPNKIDILFIDGDKAHFSTDMKLYLPLIRSKGIVLMHDIQDGNTGDAFKRERVRYHSYEIIDKSDWIKVESNKTNGIMPSTAYENWLDTWKGNSCGVGVIYLP